MHAREAGQLPQRGDGLRARRHPLLGHPVRGHTAQPSFQTGGHRHPGQPGHHVQGAQGTDRPDAREHAAPLGEAEVAHPGQPARERGHVEHELGLHELGAERHLAGQPLGLARAGVDGADQVPRRRVDGLAGEQRAVVAQGAGGGGEAVGVEVEDAGGVGVVAALGAVAGHQQHVGHAEAAGGEQVALQRDPVAVAARHLHHRVEPLGQQHGAPGEARHPHPRALVVGDVGRVHPAAQEPGGLPQPRDVGPPRRRDLRRDREPPGAQGFGEAAGSRHSHSIVPGGFEVTSRTTRLTSATSLVIRVEMRSRTS